MPMHVHFLELLQDPMYLSVETPGQTLCRCNGNEHIQGFKSLLHCHSHLSPWTLCPHKVLTSEENPCLFSFLDYIYTNNHSISSLKSNSASPAGLQSQSSFQHTPCRFSQCRPCWSFLASDKRCDRYGIFASPLAPRPRGTHFLAPLKQHKNTPNSPKLPNHMEAHLVLRISYERVHQRVCWLKIQWCLSSQVSGRVLTAAFSKVCNQINQPLIQMLIQANDLIQSDLITFKSWRS